MGTEERNGASPETPPGRLVSPDPTERLDGTARHPPSRSAKRTPLLAHRYTDWE
jgi:hypothetical protein